MKDLFKETLCEMKLISNYSQKMWFKFDSQSQCEFVGLII